ncbi:MAG: right-handed parallel beta-helix repeat-containing protein [Akkermansiaceae bacterium]|jgi:tetratricopeptide (TPR) repeat protein|nr:right-handed parallel beta-helix repeat-containing protein [Akkermansiaceae bacterium]
MTFNEARKILGLGPDEDPRPHVAEFQAARERIAEMVRNAPNENLALRYQEGLVEFDKALAALREYLEALGLTAQAPAPVVEAPPPRLEETPAPPRNRSLSWLAWLLVFLTGATGGGLLYLKNEQSKEKLRQERIAFLERQGTIYVENRRWQEAAASFAEIESLDPGSDIALVGRRDIEAGMDEEQNQFIGYWTGQALAELDAGRLDEAEAAAKRVLEKFPAETEAAQILRRVADARADQSRKEALAAARRLLDERQWETAANAARRILDKYPDDRDATAVLTDAAAAIEKRIADKARADQLFQIVLKRDQGEFDQQALEWLREAAALAPDNAEIAALLEKVSSYTRTFRVPGDFATPAEALAAARDRDRIVLAGQTWKGPLVINAAVDLQGAGSSQTVVECPPADGCPVTIGPDARGARISGIAFRHESFLADGSERFAAALVRGGGATFVDCRFSEASGHGLAVIEGGEAVASRCRFADNGWNGAAAIGQGSKLEVRDSEAIDNFEHGIESWDGAAATLVNNRCEGNSRNGIHADNRAAAAVIEGNQLIANREFGLVLGSAGSGKVVGNVCRDNLLGGIVVRAAAAAVRVTGNQSTSNRGPGMVLEKGLPAAAYASNTASGNVPSQVVTDALLDQSEGQAKTPAE